MSFYISIAGRSNSDGSGLGACVCCLMVLVHILWLVVFVGWLTDWLAGRMMAVGWLADWRVALYVLMVGSKYVCMYIKPQNKILSNLELENVVNNTDDDGRTDDEQKKSNNKTRQTTEIWWNNSNNNNQTEQEKHGKMKIKMSRCWATRKGNK